MSPSSQKARKRKGEIMATRLKMFDALDKAVKGVSIGGNLALICLIVSIDGRI
jgi:hypothetical protein